MGVYFNTPKRKGKNMDFDKISVKVDGREVDLEDAFDVFEDVFEDVEETFQHMERTFSKVDDRIKDKMESLRIKLAKKKPHKYEYIPDEDLDTEYEKIKEWQEIRAKRSVRNIIVMTVLLILMLFGIMFAAFMTSSEKGKQIKASPAIEQPATTKGGSNSL